MKVDFTTKEAKKLIYIWPEWIGSPKSLVMHFGFNRGGRCRPENRAKFNTPRPNELSIAVPISTLQKLTKDFRSKKSQAALRILYYAAGFEPSNRFQMIKPKQHVK